MTKIEKLLEEYEHLKVGKIDSSTDLDNAVLTDDWTYRKGDKEVVITYEMRHSDSTDTEWTKDVKYEKILSRLKTL